MTKLDESSEGPEQAATESKRPGKASALFPDSPERGILRSAALTVGSFLIHLLILFLVDPLRVLPLSKTAAYVVSAVPLGFGVIFAILTIYYFIKIEERSGLHLILLLIAISIGSMCLQGMLGLGLYYVKLSILAS